MQPASNKLTELATKTPPDQLELVSAWVTLPEARLSTSIVETGILGCDKWEPAARRATRAAKRSLEEGIARTLAARRSWQRSDAAKTIVDD